MKNNRGKLASVAMVASAVGFLITLVMSTIIYYNLANYNVNTIDAKFGMTVNATGVINGSRPAANATARINGQAGTFFTIAPIVAIVIVAVVVIGYVQRIGG